MCRLGNILWNTFRNFGVLAEQQHLVIVVDVVGLVNVILVLLPVLDTKIKNSKKKGATIQRISNGSEEDHTVTVAI